METGNKRLREVRAEWHTRPQPFRDNRPCRSPYLTTASMDFWALAAAAAGVATPSIALFNAREMRVGDLGPARMRTARLGDGQLRARTPC